MIRSVTGKQRFQLAPQLRVVGADAKSSSTGFIGGVNAPVVKNCQDGFTAGVDQVAPGMEVLAQYVGSFTDPSKGREVALGMETRGAHSVFAYAGLSGAGAFDLNFTDPAKLPPGTPERTIHLVGFSIVGQCVYHRVGREVIGLIVGNEERDTYTGAAIADHVVAFTLAALGLRETNEVKA